MYLLREHRRARTHTHIHTRNLKRIYAEITICLCATLILSICLRWMTDLNGMIYFLFNKTSTNESAAWKSLDLKVQQRRMVLRMQFILRICHIQTIILFDIQTKLSSDERFQEARNIKEFLSKSRPKSLFIIEDKLAKKVAWFRRKQWKEMLWRLNNDTMTFEKVKAFVNEKSGTFGI